MKVLLHIGQSKTGTSAIQAFLTLNRTKLRELGILYPAARVHGIPVNMGSHNAVADALAGKATFPYLTADQYFKDFFDEAHQIDAKLLILSAEHFFAGEPRVWDISDEKEYLARYEQKIRNLASYLAPHEVSILVYLRPQVDWFCSAISQNVRTDRLVSDKQLYHSDSQFFELLKPLLKYSSILDIWDRILKPISISAIPYDRSLLYKKSSISDFLLRAGLGNIDFPYASEDIQVNESLSREFIEVKKRLNQIPRSKNTERVMIRCLDNLSKSSRLGSGYHLDTNVQKAVKEFVFEENKRLNQKYQTNGLIFLAQSQHSAPDPEPISEAKITEAMVQFKRAYRQPQYKFLLLNYAIRAFLRTYAKPLHAVLHQFKMAYHRLRFLN